MMQKWQIRSSVCSSIRRPLRTSSQCAFSTSQFRLDDERPRSNHQASAKAGRLIANLNTRGAPLRMRDPEFGLRGLKPYNDGPKKGTANTATQPLRIRKFESDFLKQDEAKSTRDRPPQSSDRSTPRRNDDSSRPRNPERSFDRSSLRGPPRKEGGSGQYSASNPRRESRYAGDYDAAALEDEEDEYDEDDEDDEEDEDDEDDLSLDEEFEDEDLEEEEDLQAMVEEEERLATPVQEEWEVMDENGNVVYEMEEEEEEEEEELETEEDMKNLEETEREIARIEEKATEEEDGLEVEELDLYSGEDETAPAQWEQAAYEGIEISQKKLNPGPKPYNPKAMTAEELHTSFITTGAGELGVAAAAKQAMARLGRRADVDYQYDAELASRLYQGKLVRFRDAEEKKRVMWMAEEFASNTANRIMEKKGKWEPKIDVGFVALPEKAKEEITGKAMRGIYPAMPTVEGELARLGQNDQEKTMAHLRRSVLLNETYSPTQGKSMVDFIAKMWPAEPSKPKQPSEQKGA
ncbi:hypothetical protein E2P81_ATG08020 [Venturia nashicola]|nr:hypothetical protein E2P81_ATG08020 [Venturia nashicola]